jgi:glycosyltransferase involved in cell wall biosynthesis
VKFPWVNLNGFKCDEAQRRKIRREYGWSDDDIVVISLRFHRQIYGVGYLIDAIPRILAKNKNVKFLILGEGPLTSMFKARVDSFIKSGHVRFVGAVPHDKVADYLSAADIYVSTSFSDGTSASLLEAMACSLAPLVTEIPGNMEWVENGANGLLVPVADSERLAEKILSLATDHKLRARLQVNAKTIINKRVNWTKNMEKFFEIIDKEVFTFKLRQK